LNDRALELGKHAEHLKHGLIGWRAGVDTLLMEVEVDALGVEFTEEPAKSCNERPSRSTDQAAT
jgi:hypothetical protein